MTKVNSNKGNETNIFPWDTVKSDITFHLSQNAKLFQ